MDIEGGYASDPAQVGELAVRLAEAGAVGVNIEDGTEPAPLLAQKIEAVKDATSRAGFEMFVNARTDVYLAGLAEQPERVGEVLERARVYEAAGADGLFVPALVLPDEMHQIAAATKLPLNVLAWPGLPAADQLLDAGVRRLSAGSGISACVWAHTATMVQRFLSDGALIEQGMSYSDLQALFSRN